MKAILTDSKRHLHWSDVPDPVLGHEDVLVKIEAAAVNRADLMQREGDYPPPPGCPEWMGLEIAGTVEEIGPGVPESAKIHIGQKVCALLGGGGYAQYANVKYDMLMPVPDGCSLIEAAAMPEAFATAYLNLFVEGGLQSGETLLMNAGASGLASVVISMAKAFGAEVITTIIDEDKRCEVAKTGADIIVNTQSEDITSVLKARLEAGRPVDLAIDCLGGEIMGRCLPYLSHGARWIMIAALAGTMTEIDLKNIYVRNVRIIGSTLRSRKPEVKARILARLVSEIWPRVSSGEIRPTIYRVLPITAAEDAHDILYRGENVGKVVLSL